MDENEINHRQFPATRWSVVLTASGCGHDARAALEELCRLYWFPLYAFARQRGCSPEDAEDEVQEFLSGVAAGGLLARAAPDKGRLRTYLLAVFQHDLIDAHRRTHRLKRGGCTQFVTIEAMEAEFRFSSTPGKDSAEGAYDRAWAMTCLDTALCALEAEYFSGGRAALFQTLRSFLDPENEGAYTTASLATGLAPNAVRQAVFRLRQRFRVHLRQSIAGTLDHPSERLIDEELHALRAALSA